MNCLPVALDTLLNSVDRLSITLHGLPRLVDRRLVVADVLLFTLNVLLQAGRALAVGAGG